MNASKPPGAYRHSLIAVLALTLFLIIPQTVQAQGTPSSEDPGEMARRLLQAVNDARQQNGLAPLQPQSLLIQAAQGHVDDMAANFLYSHTGSDGSTVSMRTGRLGYGSRNGVSENWVSARSVAGALAWWMNSYVHRGNLLNPKWREAGIGVARDPTNGLLIFVLVFGGGDGSIQAASVSGAKSPPAAAPAVQPPQPKTPSGTPYVVQPGDTLLAIALRYDLTWQSIAALNGMNEQSLLQIGQTVLLPMEAPAAVKSVAAVGGATDDVQGHTVRSGETLVSIATRYSIPWQDLAAFNNLSATDILRIGQTLRIPVVASAGELNQPALQSASTTEPAIHTVQAGDTVISIAIRYDLDWKDLLRKNGLGEETVLSIGQQLKLN